MSVFKLDEFPNVCRLCLKPIRMELMVPLSIKDEVLGSTIGEFIQMLTFDISENKSHLLPKEVCVDCLDHLQFFAKYQSKLTIIHRLMDALAELRFSNSTPIRKLFSNQPEQLANVFRDLELCRKSKVTVKELLDEFPSYDIAFCSEHNEPEIDLESGFDCGLVADELGPEDITALQLGPRARIVKDGEEEQEDLRLMEQPEEDQMDQPEDSPMELSSDEWEIPESLPVAKPPKPKPKRSRALSKPRAKKARKKLSQLENSPNKDLETHPNGPEGGEEEHSPVTAIKTYKCHHPGCSQTFPTGPLLYKHSLNDHKPFVCDCCGLQFRVISDLERHKQRRQNELNYACPYCHKCFNVELDLKTHIKMRHDADASYKCEICGLEFRCRTSCKEHQKTHSAVYDIPCDRCDKKFRHTRGLKRHRDAVHEPKRHICEHCSKAYPQRWKLVDHIEAVHKVRMRYICDICVKTFTTQEELDLHQQCHANPAPLQCGICLDVYTSEERMQDHMCITYREDYVCCGRDFRTFYPYNTHMFRKHGQKTNFRVKPPPGVIYGVIKAQRKRIESCPKCEAIFATRTQKKLHVESCTAEVTNHSISQLSRSGNEQQLPSDAGFQTTQN